MKSIHNMNTKTPLWLCRSGMAIPMIIIFIVFMGIFIGSMTYNRVTLKRQTKTTFEYLAAHYMAQSALQHMSLKLRLLPNEAYDASALSLGLCPFNSAGEVPAAAPNVFDGSLNVFRGDVSTVTDPDGGAGPVIQGYPLGTGTDGALDSFDGTASDIAVGWGYQVTRANALTAFTSGTTRVLVIEVQAEGRAVSHVKGQALPQQRIETIKKTIEIKRAHED